jgi:hypothetical protein
VCAVTSKETVFLLLVALQAPAVIGWFVARRGGSRRWFAALASCAFGLNALVAVLAVLWASGDLG